MNYKLLVLAIVLIGIIGTATAATAQFYVSPESGLVPLSVSFSDQSTGAVKWKWDFGDGMVTTLTGGAGDISHTYTNPGIYTVTLTVNDQARKSRTVQALSPEPTPTPSPEPTTIPTTVPTTEPTSTPTETYTTVPTTEYPTTVPTTEVTTEVPTETPTPEIQMTESATPTITEPKPTQAGEPTEEPTEEPTAEVTPFEDNTVNIVAPYLPFIGSGQVAIRFQIGDTVYIIRRR